MDPELGSLEKRIKRPRRPKIFALFLTLVQALFSLAVLGSYGKLYRRSAAGTAGLAGALLCGLSQSLLQVLTNKHYPSTILRFQVWGALNGVWTHFWAGQLIEKFEYQPFRVLWDQAFGNPFGIFAFTSFTAFWEGYDVDLYLQKHYVNTLKMSWFIWPLASVIQFYLIPQKYVTLFNITMNFGWTVVLGLLM